MLIYKITNIITEDFYVGQTKKTLKHRFARHKGNARFGTDTHLYRAMRKYGIENFSIELVESLENETKLNDRERYYIAQLQPRYNMNEGGSSGNATTEKHKEAMRKYHATRTRESYATYGSKGTTRTPQQRLTNKYGNLKPCRVKGKWFFSMTEAMNFYNIAQTTFYRWRNKGLITYPDD